MKKRIAVTVLMCLMLALSACQSEAAKEADALIMAIGTVTTGSGEAIRAAENKVSMLSEKEYDSLKNYALLQEARKTYNQLCADEIIDLINTIGTVKIESGQSIAAVRKAYDELDGDLKGLVTNYDKLTSAEAELDNLIRYAVFRVSSLSLDDAEKILNNYYGANSDILRMKKDIADLKLCSGTFYQNGKYESTVDFYIKNGDLYYKVDYKGYSGTIYDDKVVRDEKEDFLFSASGTGMHIVIIINTLSTQYFDFQFGPNCFHVKWGTNIEYYLTRTK